METKEDPKLKYELEGFESNNCFYDFKLKGGLEIIERDVQRTTQRLK